MNSWLKENVVNEYAGESGYCHKIKCDQESVNFKQCYHTCFD